MLCLVPLLIVGYAQTIQTNWHTSHDISGVYAEVQTCREGLGGRTAFAQDWVQIGPQYGLSVSLGGSWSMTWQVHGGLGYSNTIHPSGVRAVTKWNGGVSFLIHYGSYNLAVGYDHMSNGRGVDPTNSGQDMVSLGMGYTF